MNSAVKLPVRQAILDRRTYEPPGEGRADKLRLDFNENTAGCSPAVRRALARLTPQLLSMYPEYDRSTSRLSRHFHVNPDQLLLTNGGDDALRLFFDAFVDAGTEVVIIEPTFPMYRYWGEVAAAKINSIPYGPQFAFPTDAVLSALASNPRVLFICNPNNPTGTLVDKSAIEKILQAAPRTAVVIDEAYVEFSGVTVAPWIDKYPQSLRRSHLLKSCRTRRSPPRRNPRASRLARHPPPRHRAIPGESRRTRRRRSRRRRLKNHAALR